MATNRDDSKLPNRVLPTSISDITFLAPWPYNDGSPWWAGGADPQPYQWSIDIVITMQMHSSNFTREPYEYNGLDVVVGDWIASISEPIRALKIVEVTEKTETTATVIIEDEFRYNTFLDPAAGGRGVFAAGSAIIFRVNQDGMPLIDPLPNIVNIFSFDSGINGRFRKFDLEHRFKFSQDGHSFVPEDIVAIESGIGFTLADSNNSAKSVGRIIEAGPAPDEFSVTAFNQIIEITQFNNPATIGDFLYADQANPGNYTTTVSGAPLLLYLTYPTPTVSGGSVPNPTVTIGHELSINGETITFTGTTIFDAMSDINGAIAAHRVAATVITPPTVIQTSIPQTAFTGVFTGTPPPGSATFNGVTVTFDSNTAAPGSYGDDADVAIDINEALIPNITATAAGGIVTVTESTGGSITIVNVTNDSFSNPIAGGGSATGLPLNTPANSDLVLHLENSSGTGIVVKDISGTARTDLGIVSTDNGLPAVGMSVAGGVRQATTTVVPVFSARDLLSPAIGDQAYVVNSDDGFGNSVGEWSLWLWGGGSWVKVSDEDSASTDAKSIENTLLYTDSGVTTVVTLSDGRRVISVAVEVLTVFDDIAATLSVGDAADDSRLMPAELVDLAATDTYNAISNFVYSSGNDENILVTIIPGASTQGEVKVVITYV